MADTPVSSQYASEEQMAYAAILDWGMKIGFLALVVTFVLYLTGLVSPHVPVDRLPELWSLPVGRYLELTGVHTGWGWFELVGKGDFMNFAGITFLSAVTIGCYLRILPIMLAKREMVYSAIIVAEVAILGLAASGILAGGH